MSSYHGFDEQEPIGRTHEIAELSQKGYQLLKENFVREAEENFKRILEYDPQNNYALVGLGDAARKRRDFHAAVDYYQRCLEYHPDNNYALFGLADCYKSLKYYNRAIKIWERYLQHDDQNVTVLTRVADAYRKVRDLRRSEEIYLQVLEMEPDNAYALIGLGHLYYDFKEYERALQYWQRMYEISGDRVDIRVLTSLGNCHRKMKTFEEGIPYFKEALEKEPNNFYALFGLADCYRGLNRQSESLQYWNRILKRDPNNKVILTRAGDAYRNMGEFEAAEEYYTKALNIEFDTYAILGLALINKEKGNYQEAIQSLEGLLKSDPNNHRLYSEIALCYLQAGQRNKALEVLSQFQRMGLRNHYISELIDRIRREA
jgi:tetratricopeptide (TPR) repeat protein